MDKLLAIWKQLPRWGQVVLVLVGLGLANAIGNRIDRAYAPPAVASSIAPTPTPAPAKEAGTGTWTEDPAPHPMKMVRPYLRQHLNDWDSYEDEGYSEPEAITAHAGQPAWRVRHTYRAKNGFGGVILNDQLFYYTASGVYLVVDAR
jgi:hypothetical protein